jgi:hypothetical protein
MVTGDLVSELRGGYEGEPAAHAYLGRIRDLAEP